MKLNLLLLFGALLGGAWTASADITVRVSVKFILGSSGQRPSNCCGYGAQGVNLTNNQAITDNMAYANGLMRRLGRGYTYQVVEIQDVSGWSGFFNINARTYANKAALEAVATSNSTTRAQFFWRTNAINLYVNNTTSGYCSFPDDNENVIFVGSKAYDTMLIHELGHYFGLSHTHQGETYLNANGTACASGCACAQQIGGTGDQVSDTIADHQCWTYAQLQAGNPGATSGQLLNTWTNIMSYHLPQDRFTSGQFDRWTDYSNASRRPSVSGATRFVDIDNFGGLFQFGLSVFPYGTVAQGVTAANSTGIDIVLVRPGNYDESLTITKAVTLRATRGTAVIGKP